MKKNLKFITLIFLLFAVIYGCKKLDTDFRNFYNNQELTYTGAVGKVDSMPGNLRVKLRWKSSTDPSIVKYVVYWNNKVDSQVVNVTTKTDSVSTIISGLQEYVYSFTIYSADAKGNRSIAKEINNVKSYGPIYASTLLNRAYNANTPYEVHEDGSLQLNFITPDTINVTTVIRYLNNANDSVKAYLAPDKNSIILPDFKFGTDIQYRSSYIPERASIDTFTVSRYDDFPRISYVQCFKSQFKEMNIANDVKFYDNNDNGTRAKRLWDGSVGPQGYPDIYHSDGDHPLPHQLTFDMGRLYNNLSQMEETGRNCCNNPDQFEVWGIDEIAGHDTQLKPNQAGWKEEALSKGWVLLKDVTRTDNGQDPYKFDLDNKGKAIRYIRLRIKHVTTGDSNYSNMSELTLWNKF